MASIAEMLIQSGLQTSKEAPDISGSIMKGAQLAQTVEEMQMKRQNLEQAKVESQNKKWSLVGNMYDQWEKMPDGEAKKNIGTKVIPAMLNTFGLSQDMNPAVAEMMSKDPTIGAFFTAKVRSGDIDFGELTDAMRQPDTFLAYLTAKGYGQYADEKLLGLTRSTLQSSLPELKKASEEKVSSNEQDRRAKMQADASLGKQIQGQEAAPFVRAGEEAAKEFSNYKLIGGSAGYDKTEAALKEAIAALRSGKVQTGKGAQAIPVIGGSRTVIKATNKPLQALRNKVLSTQNMKALLGDPNPAMWQVQDAQERIIDGEATNEVNIANLEAELKRVQTERADKEARLREAGFLKSGAQSGPKDGDTKEWQGKKYKVIKGRWVEVK